MDPTDAEASALARLASAGTAVWLDAATRAHARSGRLASYALDGVSGITTSPQALAAAIRQDHTYATDLAALAETGAGPAEAAAVLAADDAREACDVLRGIFDASAGRNGWVTVPIDPRLARDTERTLRAVRSMRALVDRPNVLVAIPATKQGIYAILAAVAEGISVTATTVFSRDRFRAVQLAYLEGLERAELAGRDLATIASFVTLPLAPIEAAVASARSDQPATALGTQVPGALAVLAYAGYEAHRPRPRWQALAASGARPQRPVWTSIGADAAQTAARAGDLVGRGAVLALDEQALAVVRSATSIGADTVHEQYGQAQRVLDEAERAGLGLEQIAASLHADAVARDAASWDEMLSSVSQPPR